MSYCIDTETAKSIRRSELALFCDNTIDAERLSADFDDGYPFTRQEFCETFGVGNSTLSGWLTEDRMPGIAKIAYVLAQSNQLLNRSIRQQDQKTFADYHIVKDGETYSLISLSKTEDGATEGNVVARQIEDIQTARQLANSRKSLRLNRDYAEMVHYELSIEYSDHLSESFDEIKSNLLYSLNYEKWRRDYGDRRFELWEAENPEDAKKLLDSIAIDLGNDEISDIPTSKGSTPHRYTVWVLGQSETAKSLGEVVSMAFRLLNEVDPDAFEKLNNAKRSGVRKFIGKTPEEVYKGNRDLAKNAIKVSNGWWTDGNISTNQARTMLKSACELLEIEWGKDISFERR